jgi:hypothetical protein
MSEFLTQADKVSINLYHAIMDNYYKPVPEWVILEKDLIIDSLRNAWISGASWRVGQLMSKHQEEVERLKMELEKERVVVDDFILEQEHMSGCPLLNNWGELTCSCMDRSYYAYDKCLERARQRQEERKNEHN